MRILLICFTILFTGCSKDSQLGKAIETLLPEYESCAIKRIEEGNIFYCESPGLSVLKVKTMGVTIYEGQEKQAKEFTKSILKFGSNVWLSLDNRVREDKGILSAFVFLQDKTFFNALLIREGIGYESFEGKEAKYKENFDQLYYKELSGPIDYEVEVEEEIKIENEEKAPWLK